MFNLQETNEAALTPEVGGKFGEMKILIKPFLKEEADKFRKEFIKTEFHPKTHRAIPVFDSVGFGLAHDEKILSLIVGWENVLVENEQLPFDKDHVSKLLNYADALTGHKQEFDIWDPESMKKIGKETRTAKLFEYLFEFVQNVENFEKN